ncbi:CLUMA_CG002664, isoform A [Clunio marinus]|uniref:CLUMA_CG002664, isoform A n=1 Tax=Clunio marinus TaxID=568069 RepID=A0A1J1HL28_9DIPT|nr:CLUMA_CG002664, isoform A [Clunio marinus]
MSTSDKYLLVSLTMSLIWERSTDLKSPLIYSHFERQDFNGNNIIKYRIEDLQQNRFEDALNIMKNKHLLDEPMYSAKGIHDDPISFNEMIENWKKMLRQKISIVCYQENSDEIVAVNILGVVTEKEFDAPHNYRGKGWSEVNNLKKFLKMNFFNPFSNFNVDKIMFAAGLYVHENHRNRGIAVEMLKAREEIGKANSIKISSNVFSSLGAQKAAVKVGFEESFAIEYSKLPDLTSDVPVNLGRTQIHFITSSAMYSWARPNNVDFPITYSRFVTLDSDIDNKLIEYRIEDLQENRFDDAVHIIREKHLIDEPMKSSKGVRDCPISVQEMTENLRNMLRQNISLVCYKEGSNDIVAVNILGVITEAESDAPLEHKGQRWAEHNNTKNFIKKTFFDPFKHFQIDKVMCAGGLFVNKEYRNRGIAVEMLKARHELGKVIGIQVSSNVFSSLGAQKAAAKVGFEESFSIKYSDIPKLTTDGHYPNIKDEYMKIMSKRLY